MNENRLTRPEYLSLAEIVAWKIIQRYKRGPFKLGQLRAALAAALHEGFADWILNCRAGDYEEWTITTLSYDKLRRHISYALLTWEPPAYVLGVFRTHTRSPKPAMQRYERLADALITNMFKRTYNLDNVSRALRKLVRPMIMANELKTARIIAALAHGYRQAHLDRTDPEY